MGNNVGRNTQPQLLRYVLIHCITNQSKQIDHDSVVFQNQ
jgi:hypothetical protein